jgi:ubiquinone/menaquinone biosynthesis C-methylase UbiE
MAPKLDTGVELQRKYYTDTATRYEQMHEHEGSGDALGNEFVHAILRMVDARSVLDVGTATGRGLRELKETLPGAFVCGIEPVAALLAQAASNGNTASGSVV